jgi:hypothetical protein
LAFALPPIFPDIILVLVILVRVRPPSLGKIWPAAGRVMDVEGFGGISTLLAFIGVTVGILIIGRTINCGGLEPFPHCEFHQLHMWSLFTYHNFSST